MEDKLDFPENKLRDFIQGADKAKWIAMNNHNIRYFTEDEVKRITNNYSIILGNGSFGKVYKGTLDDNCVVAVKRYTRMDSEEEFAKEIIVHSQINHKNVVRLIGCCIKKNAAMIVLEYVSNGNLGENLHGTNTPISLDKRLTIAIQCAEALWCMHSMYNPVLHGDIKPSNILLDDKFHAKISDFGISRLLSGDHTQHTVVVKGSFGYMDPEHYEDWFLTTKSDVYSLGVVLLELITREKAINGECNLVKRFNQASAKGKGVRKLFDTKITDESNLKILDGIAKIAKDCLKEHVGKRPGMKEVATRLQELRTTQEKTSSNSVLHKMKNLGVFSSSAENNFTNREQVLRDINNIKIFTKTEIKNITHNFSTILGKGRYGSVYLGALDDNTQVAVKTFTDISHDDFDNEVIIQSQIHHRNSVKLFGYCLQMDRPISVYEYMPNGSLEECLFVAHLDTGTEGHDKQQFLELKTRYQIALGVARVIVHLHERPKPVLHCNIKPHNILLDEHFCPKVSKFMFSMMLSKHDDSKSLFLKTDESGGRLRYMAPEWISHSFGPITSKADVYSFGKVLLEIVSRCHNMDIQQGAEASEYLVFPSWVYQKIYVQRRIEDILDPRIVLDEADENTVNSAGTVERMMKTALCCIQLSANKRPSMSKVIKMLQGTIEISEPADPYSSFNLLYLSPTSEGILSHADDEGGS